MSLTYNAHYNICYRYVNRYNLFRYLFSFTQILLILNNLKLKNVFSIIFNYVITYIFKIILIDLDILSYLRLDIVVLVK